MRHSSFHPATSVVLTLALGACASVDPGPDYEQTEAVVSQATGVPEMFQPGEEEQAAERVTELMDGGLSAEEAVQVCLLNNREIQVLLFEIGVRRADAVQAGLLSNPSLGALVRFPLGDGSTTTELGLVQNVAELWQLSPRKRLAESQLEQAVFEVAHAAAGLAFEAKAAYFRATAAVAALIAAEENRDTANEFLELTLERQAAGAATQVDVNSAHSQALEQEAMYREARFVVFDTRRALALLLNLAGPLDALQLSDAISEAPEWSVDLPHLIALAEQSRLDLRAAGKALDAAEHALKLEKRSVFRSLDAGLSFENDGGETQLGPVLEMEIPLFDQNQAQIAKAEFRRAQALRRFEALGVQVDLQVRGAYEQYALATDTARLYAQELLPLRRSSLELARESFKEGKTGFLSVLEAQSSLLEARRTYVGRLEAVAVSIPALEAACGRPLRDLLEPEAPPRAASREVKVGER